MRIREKWRLLTIGSRWDRSTVPIYEAAGGGRLLPLLKTLLTSHCTNNCTYCAFRSSRKCPRESWEPRELAEITFRLWMEGRIVGLFLSSSVFRDPDYITEKQLETLRILRGMGYTGYIHLRMMPGVSRHYIHEVVELADRVGVNLEAPSGDVFAEICPNKGGYKEAVMKRLSWIVEEAEKVRETGLTVPFGYCRSGVDTQLIVGAVTDNDLQFIRIMDQLYNKFGLRRIYLSGFEPVKGTPLERNPPCPPFREYRLYQCSFLIRDYGFKAEEIAQILDDRGFLPNIDPKILLARKNRDMFPIDLNSATYHEMLRVPGIGPTIAKRIIEIRDGLRIRYFSDLEKVLGPNLARAISPYIYLKDRRLTYFSK